MDFFLKGSAAAVRTLYLKDRRLQKENKSTDQWRLKQVLQNKPILVNIFVTSGNAGWEILANCRSESAGPFLSCDMKWKLRKATCHTQWIDVILFSRTLIDVHVGWISSATHDPDKPSRRRRWYVVVAVMKVVNTAAQRIGAGARERESDDPFMLYRLNLSMKRQAGRVGAGDDVGGRRTHTLHAGRSVPQTLPAGSHVPRFTFGFSLIF